MGREEVVATIGTVHMAHHGKESRMLQEEIGIYVDNGIIAHFYLVLILFLYGVLCNARHIVGCIVFCEISHVGTKVAVEHVCYLESQE